MRISDWSSDVCSSDLPLAGPVTAGAAWLDAGRLDPALACRIDDSKKLTPQTRREIFAALSDPAAACAVVAVGEASVEEIDSINILQASLLAMQRADEALIASLGALTPARLVHGALVAGHQLPKLPCPEIGSASCRDRVCQYV